MFGINWSWTNQRLLWPVHLSGRGGRGGHQHGYHHDAGNTERK